VIKRWLAPTAATVGVIAGAADGWVALLIPAAWIGTMVMINKRRGEPSDAGQ
jgi:hypothetical protein